MRLLGGAISAITKVQKDMHMPASLQADFQGTAASFRNSLSNMPLLILAALVTVYIVLGVLYESFIHPITILSTLPSAGVGAFLALILVSAGLERGGDHRTGSADRHREEERHHDGGLRAGCGAPSGKNATDAIYEACLLRFRPIMMTTMAALLGGLPLAFGTGIGSELRRPLGIAMVGGLAAEPGTDAVHDAGHLYLLRQSGARVLAEVARSSSRDASPQPAGAVMNLSAPFIHRPVATTLLTVAIAIAGAIAFHGAAGFSACRRWIFRPSP